MSGSGTGAVSRRDVGLRSERGPVLLAVMLSWVFTRRSVLVPCALSLLVGALLISGWRSR